MQELEAQPRLSEVPSRRPYWWSYPLAASLAVGIIYLFLLLFGERFPVELAPTSATLHDGKVTFRLIAPGSTEVNRGKTEIALLVDVTHAKPAQESAMPFYLHPENDPDFPLPANPVGQWTRYYYQPGQLKAVVSQRLEENGIELVAWREEFTDGPRDRSFELNAGTGARPEVLRCFTINARGAVYIPEVNNWFKVTELP